jgi:hypothetical protein
MSTAEFHSRFEDLTRAAEQARAAVESGGARFDLGTLEGDVAVLCEAVQGEGPETARALQEPMAALISELDRLAAALETCRKDNAGSAPQKKGARA